MTTLLKYNNINLYINYALIAYAFMIPISKAGTVFFELLLILLWFLEGNFKKKFTQYKSNYLILSLAMLFLYSIIILFWKSDLYIGLDYIKKYWHFSVIFIIFTSLNEKYIKHIFSAFIFSMFISEIISYGMFFELLDYTNPTYHGASKTFPTPFLTHLDYSVYLSFTIIVLFYKLLSKTDIQNKVIYAFFALSMTTNLFINSGRTGQVIFIISLILVFTNSFQNKFKGLFLSILMVFSILSVAYNFSPNFHNRTNTVINDISNMINEHNFKGSITIRASFWVMGIDELTNKFSFGSGIGNEMSNVPYYADKHGFDKKFLMEGYVDHHNMFITYGIQLGQIGLLLFLLVFVSLFRLKFSSPQLQGLNLVFIITFILWSSLGSTFHLMDAMTFFALFAGLLNKISTLQKANSQTKNQLETNFF